MRIVFREAVASDHKSRKMMRTIGFGNHGKLGIESWKWEDTIGNGRESGQCVQNNVTGIRIYDSEVYQVPGPIDS
jgi:hypothetical protein